MAQGLRDSDAFRGLMFISMNPHVIFFLLKMVTALFIVSLPQVISEIILFSSKKGIS